MVSISIDITQGASLWEPDGADHVKPKGSKKINVAYLELDSKVDKVTGKGLSENDFTDALESKLNGIEESANNYAHPSNHDPSIITQDSDNRFVSDTQINTWNGKQDAIGFTPENVANKKTTLADNSDTYYPSQKAVKTAVDSKLSATRENRITPTLLNGWLIRDLAPFTYYKNQLGDVHFEGHIIDGSIAHGTSIFTLPEGYRPVRNLYVPALCVDQVYELRIFTSGDVQILFAQGATWLSLGGISFSTIE